MEGPQMKWRLLIVALLLLGILAPQARSVWDSSRPRRWGRQAADYVYAAVGHESPEGNSTEVPASPSPSPPTLAPPTPVPGPTTAPSCAGVRCEKEMNISCAARTFEDLQLFSPDVASLERIAANKTVFLMMYTIRPDDAGKPVNEFVYNTLFHFQRAVGGTMLLSSNQCPFPALDVVSLRSEGRDNETVRPKVPIRPDTVLCHALPHPCTCPGNDLYSRCKLAVVLSLLLKGFHVFWSESDTALLENPLPRFHAPPGTDMIGNYERGYHINQGLMHLRASNDTVHAFRRAFFSLNENGHVELRPGFPVFLFEQGIAAQLFSLKHRRAAGYPRLGVFDSGGQRVTDAPVASANEWPVGFFASRATNKKRMPTWREAAKNGELVAAHSSGGCSSHVFGKKGVLIELRAWYDPEAVSRFWDSPQTARLESYKYTLENGEVK